MDSGPYSAIATGLTSTSFSNTGLFATTTYYYVVSAATEISAAAETANSATEASAVAGCTTIATPTVSYNNPVYAGMTLYLTASSVSGATYNWTGPNGFSSVSQNPYLAGAGQNASGIYSVTATVGGCASAAGTTTVTVNPPVNLSIQASASSLVFNWPYGTLQSATNVAGPWSAVTGVTSPYTNSPSERQQFFRVKVQ